MIRHQQIGYVLLLLSVTHLIDATAPTFDNIVKLLQSPTFSQIIVPQALVAADSPIAPETAKPIANDAPVADSKNTPADPTLRLVTRVLDTLRSAAPQTSPLLPASSPLVLVPQRRALPGCPLCDASVYSYCDYKVFHDGCCCGSMNGYGGGFGGLSNGIGYGGCGYQEDCSFLYANSCYEHQLIVNCCCNAPF